MPGPRGPLHVDATSGVSSAPCSLMGRPTRQAPFPSGPGATCQQDSSWPQCRPPLFHSCLPSPGPGQGPASVDQTLCESRRGRADHSGCLTGDRRLVSEPHLLNSTPSTVHHKPGGQEKEVPCESLQFLQSLDHTHTHTCSDPCTHALPRPWGRSADIPVFVTGHTRHPLPQGPQLLHIRAVRLKGGPGLPCSACISATLRVSVCCPGT